MANNILKKLKVQNEYYTPNWVWDYLKEFIPKGKVIWECFRNDSPLSCCSANYLRSLGFEVVNPLCDFFDNNLGDIVVSNPPFDKKKEVLQRLIELDKPFMLVLPNIILNTIYFIDMCKIYNEIQIIILPKRVDFIKQNADISKCPFHTLVVCYKMNLNERLIFI
jgi:hypothetical protein